MSAAEDVFFTDQTQNAGITYYNTCGSETKSYVLEAHGSGSAFFDADNDGDMDLYIANGSTLETFQKQIGPGNVFYENTGKGSFADLSEYSRLNHKGWGTGITVGDINSDGLRDLYVTNYGPNILFLNKDQLSFQDISDSSNIASDDFSASSAFLDFDNDGDLDLYVTNYVVFDATSVPVNPNLCSFFGGIQVYCGPKGLIGAEDRLYRNEGNARFTDVTIPSQIAKSNSYYGLGVMPIDYDIDGWTDIFVANDETPNVLFKNQSDGTFKDLALLSGVAYNGDGETEAGMGVDAGDYDNDGDFDLYVTHFFTETNTLYNNNNARFTDVTTTAGLAASTVDLLAWGTKFFDYDNDGLLDLFVANGHVYPQVDNIDAGSKYRQRNQLFINMGNGRFAQPKSDQALSISKVSRGSSVADYDNDGDSDIFIVNLNDSPTLLRNEIDKSNNWIAIHLIGSAINRDGIGSRVAIKTSNVTQWRYITGAGSYLSYNDIRAYVGLGAEETVLAVSVIWPDGSESEIKFPEINRLLAIQYNGDSRSFHLYELDKVFEWVNDG
ncbi:MAG: CRTAC1 family protein [Candidatus Latescibacterota bacterium]|nr:CRTAC1 family protein [Candidatus Latescibacterota bacterium]